MANGHGGARAGAGRPRKAEKYAGQIAAAEDKIAQKLPQLVDRLLEMGIGREAGYDVDAGTVVPEIPACRHVAVYLVNRILGRPVLEVEHTGKDGGPIEVNATHRTVAQAEIEAWRAEMKEKLSSLPSAPPTTGTSSTPTG